MIKINDLNISKIYYGNVSIIKVIINDENIFGEIPPIYCTTFLSAGWSYSTILRNGQIWSWGLNVVGNLGDNSTTSRLTPVSIKGQKKVFCKINIGLNSSGGIDYSGQVWSWGENVFGKLGINSDTSKRTPVSIHGNKKTFCNIGIGTYNVIGLEYNGQVWCWGYNQYGQLGNDSISHQSTPVSILGTKKTFCKIASGDMNVVTIDKDGLAWGWGINGSGQLGDNTVISRRTPISVLGAKKTFCEISSGGSHSLAIDYYGQIWSWGNDGWGQLGVNRSANSKKTPVSILGAKKTFCQIDCGTAHSVGIDYNGQAWCWGDNQFGQLGDNSELRRSTPVSILGAKKTFCKISAGNDHTLAMDKDGGIWCWGYNYYGQLGNSVTTSHCTPIRVYNF